MLLVPLGGSGPAAADVAIDKFCEAMHTRLYCFHVFAIPLLITNLWRKQLLNAHVNLL
jgi:hypothetical protein